MVGMTFKSKKHVWWLSGKESSCQCRRYKRWGFDPWVGKIPTRVGNGNPLQYSCLENSIDRGAWWATVYGVAKSQTWLSHVHTCTLTPVSLSLSLTHTRTHLWLQCLSLSLSHTHAHTNTHAYPPGEKQFGIIMQGQIDLGDSHVVISKRAFP